MAGGVGSWLIKVARSIGLGRLVGAADDDMPQNPDVEEDLLPPPPRRPWQGGGTTFMDDDLDWLPRNGARAPMWNKDEPGLNHIRAMVRKERNHGAQLITVVITAIFEYDSDGNPNTNDIETTLAYVKSYSSIMDALNGATSTKDFVNRLLARPEEQGVKFDPSAIGIVDKR